MATVSQLGDLIMSTQKDLGKLKIADISQPLQAYVAMRELLKKGKLRKEVGSGYGFQWDVKVRNSGNARNVGLGEVDQVNIVDMLQQASTDWANSTTNWAIIRQEIAMNRSPAKIVDLITVRRQASMMDMVILMEDNIWKFPLVADTKTPKGIPYWVTKNATEGFNGGIPSGYSLVAGLSPTTWAGWNNWTYQYVDVTYDDFVRHIREAFVKTNFMPPVDGIATFNDGNSYGAFTNYAVIRKLEDLVKNQNENIGNDLAWQDGKAVINRVGCQYVPRLDEDTTGPFYGLNFGDIEMVYLASEWMNETNIDKMPNQHTVAVHHTDCTYQTIFRSRRGSFVAATGTSYP